MSDRDIGDLLRQHGLRVTPQRRAIIRAFHGTPDEHLSADEVLSRASATVPDIGRGTVYSTLAELTELGLLLSLGHPEPVRYELNGGAHDHFRCRLCLRLFNIEFGGRELTTRPLAGFTVETVAVRVDGVCSACRDYERGLTDGTAAVHRDPALSRSDLEAAVCRRHDSPLGILGLAMSAAGLIRIAFAEHADFETIEQRARSRRGSPDARARLHQLVRDLDSYLAGSGDTPEIDLMLPVAARPFSAAIAATREIPYGEPRSYHRLGDPIDAYRCGYALGSNPTPLTCPCHRVTCGNHRTETYVGGTERLHFLQQLESGRTRKPQPVS